MAFDFRYKGILKDRRHLGIRNFFREKENIQESDDKAIFGYMKDNEKDSSKINISHLFKENEDAEDYFLKIWGILPKKCSYTSEVFLEKVEKVIPNEFERIDKKTGRDVLGDS